MRAPGTSMIAAASVAMMLCMSATHAAALPRRARPGPGPGPRTGCAETIFPQGAEQRWRGEWASADGWNFGYVLHLTRRGNAVAGYFEWTLRITPDPGMASRVGNSAREYVRGTLDGRTCSVSLAGYRITDATLIGADQYALTIATDGALSGRTRGNDPPLWSPQITGTRAP